MRSEIEAWVESFRTKIRRDRFVGNAIRGSLPVMPQLAALPTAGADYAYCIVVIPGTPDVSYQCLRDAGGAWGWRVIATG